MEMSSEIWGMKGVYILIYIYNIDYLKWCWFIESTPRTGCLIEQPLLGHSGRLYFFIQNFRFASKLSETDLRAGMDCEDECYSSSAVILPCTHWTLMKSLKKMHVESVSVSFSMREILYSNRSRIITNSLRPHCDVGINDVQFMAFREPSHEMKLFQFGDCS